MSGLPRIDVDDLESLDNDSEAPQRSKPKASMRRLGASSDTVAKRKSTKVDDSSSTDDAKSDSALSKSEKRKSSRMSRRFDEGLGSDLDDKKKAKSTASKSSSPASDFARALAAPVRGVISYGAAAGHAVGHFASGLVSPMLKKGGKKKKAKETEYWNAQLEYTFEGEDFDVAAYVQRLFEEKNADDIREYMARTFTRSKEEAARRLQESVHDNYRTFITTSKEISNLEVDMLELRNHLTEVNAAIKGLQQITFNFDKAPLRRQPRHLQEQSQLVKDIHWLLELPDELDILVSEREFEAAVTKIEKARTFRTSQQLALAFSSIADDLDERISKLAETLCKDLQNPALKKSESRTIITYLSRLGYAKRAREIFLDTRSRKVASEIKKLRYENDVSLYINELARIVFTAIDSTCDDFLHCFKDRDMLSGFVVWTIREMSQILTLFRQHVFYSSEIDNFAVVGKCFEIARAHCKTLESRGLSLVFYLRQTFHTDLVSVIRTFYSRVQAAVNKQLLEEKWDTATVSPTQFGEVEEAGSPRTSKESGSSSPKEVWAVTESAKSFESFCVKFVNGIVSVWSPELLPTVIQTMSGLLENYLTDLSTLMRGGQIENLTVLSQPQQNSDGPLGSSAIGNSMKVSSDSAGGAPTSAIPLGELFIVADKQALAIVADAMYIADYFAPLVISQIQNQIATPVPDLEALRARVSEKALAIRTFFVEAKSRDLVHGRLAWEAQSYPEDHIDEDSAEPGQKFIRLFEYMYRLGTDINSIIAQRLVRPMLGQIWEQAVRLMSADPLFWSKEQDTAKKAMMGLGGLQQFVLDMKFCLQASNTYVTEDAKRILREMHERAVVNYCLSNNVFNPNEILKPEKWYTSIVKSAMLTLKALKI
eukprot:TRINITY_DN690_c0_g2_i1.p1 TRINITY_DN690_c0_g2~~TRINITY_DN690_c0_g2_i1.p1  ORF type:complete len:932 (+),score=179.78 TRINITY_DN690_c0_g2_i1:156-2798(+)